MNASGLFCSLAGVLLIGIALQDAFEVVLLPRSVRRHRRLMRYFFRVTWGFWVRVGAGSAPGPRREAVLGIYGPSSMVLLFALWASLLIAGFGFLQWGLNLLGRTGPALTLVECLFVSGDAFFTLGYEAAAAHTSTMRLLVIAEAGVGFGFVALTISYLPVLQQHFFQRDVQLVQLAARAGSPPAAVALVLWHVTDGSLGRLDTWLHEWELWAGELIESHSSYPMLAFYRSQHENQSWLASLAVVLDCCTLILAGFQDQPFQQAESTFLVARRVLAEMCRSLGACRRTSEAGHGVSATDLRMLNLAFSRSGCAWDDTPSTRVAINRLRSTYEPLLGDLSAYLLLPLPGWAAQPPADAGDITSRDAAIRRLTR